MTVCVCGSSGDTRREERVGLEKRGRAESMDLFPRSRFGCLSLSRDGWK